MEASVYGLTHGTCFVARRLELVAVAGLPWISWCILGATDFSCSFLVFFCFFERYTACCEYEAVLPHLYYLLTSTEVRTGLHYLLCLSVCCC